ncbi:hypothetical protein [Niabella ginsenosidivorans]|nr:hypothetical protein [Niabella ginsenosidivorans]
MRKKLSVQDSYRQAGTANKKSEITTFDTAASDIATHTLQL